MLLCLARIGFGIGVEPLVTLGFLMFGEGPLELAEKDMPAELEFEDSFEFLEKKKFPSCEENEPERDIDLD